MHLIFLVTQWCRFCYHLCHHQLISIWDGGIQLFSFQVMLVWGQGREPLLKGPCDDSFYEEDSCRLSPQSVLVNLDFHTFSSVQFSHSVVSDCLWPHGLQHARVPCLLSTPEACSDSCPSSRWCHPTISSSVFPFSSCLQPFPASGSFLMSQFFASGAGSIGVAASASAFQWIQWFLSGLTGWISLQSKRLTRVFSNTTVQKHQFFNTQLSFWSNSHIHKWLLEKP